MASVPGSTRAAPIPWNALAAIKTPVAGASAQPIDAIPNRANPISTTRLCPRRSPMVPLASSREASGRA